MKTGFSKKREIAGKENFIIPYYNLNFYHYRELGVTSLHGQLLRGNSKITVIILAALFAVALNLEAHAEEKVIRLICEYSHTIDTEKGTNTETSGEEFVTINYLDNGAAAIKKQARGVVFVGTISEEIIQGEAIYDIFNVKVKESIIINRYSGTFKNTFHIEGAKGSLIHYGVCELVKKKKF